MDNSTQVVPPPPSPATVPDLLQALGGTPDHFLLLKGSELTVTFANASFRSDWAIDSDISGLALNLALPRWKDLKILDVLKTSFQSGTRSASHEEEVKTTSADLASVTRFSYTCQPLFDGRPQASGLLVTGTNVTGQPAGNNNNREMAASADRLRQLYEAITGNTPDLIYVFDLDYRFSYANQALLQMWGKAWENAVGKGLRENGYEEWHAQMHEREIDQIVATKQSIRGEVSFPHATLGERIYDYLLVPVLNADGDVEAVAGTTRDISDIKYAQEIVKTNEEHLRVLVEQKTRELSQSNEELQRFAHVASHDLKEPLRKIKLFSSRIKELPIVQDSPLLSGYAEKIEKSSGRMQAMIDGVLNYSTISGMGIVPVTVDLNNIVQSVCEDLEVMITESGASVLSEKLPLVSGSAVLITQLFYNLLTNSLKFQRPGSVPVIRVRSVNKRPEDESGRHMVHIFISDNGIGFSREEENKIFQTFVRLNPKDQFEGTGLGLTLCKKIVERHGGKIEAHALPDGGAEFGFTLPGEAAFPAFL